MHAQKQKTIVTSVFPLAMLAATLLASAVEAQVTPEFAPLPDSSTIVTQDDVEPLLAQAQKLTQSGQYEQAVAVWEFILKVPAKPDARPPGLLPGPRDYRGEARWGLAETRRAQGKWQEALELYRLNRATYPRNDGCVPSGGAFQEMALTEGVCLEHLGKFDEAAKSYFAAALPISSSVPPYAMRRLVDLYIATDQIKALKTAVQRAKANFIANCTIDPKTGYKLEGVAQKRLADELLFSLTGIPNFEIALGFRKAAYENHWQILIEALQKPLGPNASQEIEHQYWRRQREAISALALKPQVAVPILQSAISKTKDATALNAALQECKTPVQTGDFITPIIFPEIPQNLKLPAELSVAFQVL